MIQDVITMILEDQESRFLLLRRSSRVRTYPGVWGAVSGRVEPGYTPDAQAQQELLEETGLSAERAFEGEPFLVRDPPLGAFRVHPFLYRCDTPPKIALNQEHTELRWVRALPAEEATVPALGESLRRARGGARRWLSVTTREALLRWREDQASGAVDLAVQGAKLLASSAREYPGEDAEARVCMLRGLGVKMQEAHPDMPIIPRAFGYVLRGLREAGAAGASLAAQGVEDKLREARRVASQRAAEHLHQQLQQQNTPWSRGAWLTLSASSTVQLAFEALTERLRDLMTVELRVLESRPLGEGVALAKRLAESGCAAVLYPDMAMMQALAGCQGVLLGADAIFSDGSARNKLGSALLARLAKQQRVPVYVITEAWKVSAEYVASQQMLSGEVAVAGAGGLAAWVPLFEVVPSGDITAILTEDGTLDAKRLEKLSERRSLWPRRPFLVWGDNFEEA